MTLHPHISSLNGRERQRELTAQAARLRQARQLSDLARTSRRAAETGRQRRARRIAAAFGQLVPRYRTAR